MQCYKCNKELSLDEIALDKKLFGKYETKHRCIECSAEYLGVTVQLLEEKIKYYKEMGCTLFSTTKK